MEISPKQADFGQVVLGQKRSIMVALINVPPNIDLEWETFYAGLNASVDTSASCLTVNVDSTQFPIGTYQNRLDIKINGLAMCLPVTFEIVSHTVVPAVIMSSPLASVITSKPKSPAWKFYGAIVFLILIFVGMFVFGLRYPTMQSFLFPTQGSTVTSVPNTEIVIVPTDIPPTRTPIPTNTSTPEPIIVPTLYDTPTYEPTDIPPTETPIPYIVPTDTLEPPTRTVVKEATPTKYPFYCQGALPSRVWVGAYARITLDVDLPNRVRTGPGLGYKQIGTMDPGTTFQVTDGPKCNNQITWWEVNNNGWTAESQNDYYFIEPYGN